MPRYRYKYRSYPKRRYNNQQRNRRFRSYIFTKHYNYNMTLNRLTIAEIKLLHKQIVTEIQKLQALWFPSYRDEAVLRDKRALLELYQEEIKIRTIIESRK